MEGSVAVLSFLRLLMVQVKLRSASPSEHVTELLMSYSCCSVSRTPVLHLLLTLEGGRVDQVRLGGG